MEGGTKKKRGSKRPRFGTVDDDVLKRGGGGDNLKGKTRYGTLKIGKEGQREGGIGRPDSGELPGGGLARGGKMLLSKGRCIGWGT